MPRVANAQLGESTPQANIFRVLSHQPEVLRGFMSLGGRLLQRGLLDPRVRELVICAVAVNLGCDYEWSHHVRAARDEGVTDDELRAVRGRKVETLGEAERTAIRYALAVESKAVTDADVDELRRLGLSDPQIVELTILAGFYGMTARLLISMDVAIDQGFEGDFREP